MTFEQLAAELQVGSTLAYELRNEPWFPKPIPLSSRVVRYSRADLERAVEAMPRAMTSEPERLRRKRIESMKAGGEPAAAA